MTPLPLQYDSDTPAAATLSRPTQTSDTLRLRAKTGYVAFVALYGAIFSVWQIQPVPLEVHAASVLLAAIAIAPMAIWYARGFPGAPMFELICLAYLVQFGMPTYIEPNQLVYAAGSFVLPWRDAFDCLLLASIGLAMAILGYYAVLIGPLGRRVTQLDLPIRDRLRNIYITPVLIVGIAFTALETVHGSASLNALSFGAILTILARQADIGLALLAFDHYSNGPNGWNRRTLIFYSVAFALALLGLATGLLENMLLPFIIIAAVQWQETRKAPLRLLAAGIIALALLQPIKAQYRSSAEWRSPGSSLVSRLGLWKDLAGAELTSLLTANINNETATSLQTEFQRLDLLHQFMYVHEQTPNHIPYLEGVTYQYMVYGWIPRLIWPGKPIAQQANVIFELTYGINTADQTKLTMSGVGIVPEAYINFGNYGVVGVMLVFGMILGLFSRVLNGSTSDGGRAIYVSYTAWYLNGIGSNFADLVAGILQYTLVNAIIMKVFSSGFHRHALLWKLAKPGESVLNRKAEEAEYR